MSAPVAPHRRHVAIVFADLHGFTEFVVSAAGELVSATDIGEVAFRNMRPFRAFRLDERGSTR